MKNKRIGIFVCILVILATIIPVTGTVIKNSIPCPPKLGLEWEKKYGGNLIDWGNCIQQTSDGGYIISGTYYRNAWSLWYSYFYLIKIDIEGNEEWSQTYGPYDSEHVGKCVQQTKDGGYVVAGFQGVTYKYDITVHKTDENGTLIWSQTFGDPDAYDIAQSIQQTSDGGYIVTGTTNSFGAELSDILLLKIDANGKQEWVITLGGFNQDSGNCIKETSDGGFVIVGETDSYGNNGDVYLVKTDNLGEEEWNKTFGGNGWDVGNSVQQTTDDGYIISGRYENEDGNVNVFLLKTDSSGNELWNKTFGGKDYDEGYCVQQTSDGGYFIVGFYTDPKYYDPDILLIKTDTSGNMVWKKVFDNNDAEDVGYYGIETSDGGFIVTGYTGFYLQEIIDVWVIKLGAENHAPNTPIISGLNSGKSGISYLYTFNSRDPDGDDIDEYIVNWGDGPDELVIGPFVSGEEKNLSHTWTSQGIFTVKVKAKDIYGYESDWAEFTVTMPRTKINTLLMWLYTFLQNHPNLFPILRLILQQLEF